MSLPSGRLFFSYRGFMKKSKKCRVCKKRKSVELFQPQADCKDGRSPYCKKCMREIGIKWRAENRERHNRLLAIYKLRKQGVSLNIDDVELLLKKQKNLCAICRKPETFTSKGRKSSLSLDHCHTTLKFRGLLCWKCNLGLFHFSDDIGVLKSAIRYLRS